MAGSGVELATAYVTIIPSLKGAGKSINSQLGGIDLSQSGMTIGKSLTAGISKGISTDSLSALNAAVSSAESSVSNAMRKSEQSAKQLEVAQKRLAEAREKYGNDSSQAAQAELNLMTAQTRAESAAKELEDAQNRLADAQDRATEGAKAHSSALRKLSSVATSVGDGLKTAGSKVESLGNAIMPVSSALIAGGAAAGAFALKTASAAETTEISFTTMLGSEEAALSMMETLADFAAHTPFELSGLQTATRQLLAYGFTAEDVIPMLTAVGDATAALGTGQAGIESVTRALGQMQTRGKVSAEEMLQLTEAGIPAWEYLARAIGTDTAGAMDAVTRGAISASEGIDAIVSGMENDFGGMMEEQSKTVEGLFSNLSDAIEQPLMKLRDSDAYERFADSLSDVVDSAGPFVESLLPYMESGLDAVSGVLDAATDAMDSFADMGEEGQDQLIGMVTAAAAAGPALTIAGKGMQLLGGSAKGTGSLIKAGQKAVGTFGDAILDFATAPDTASTVLGKFAGVLAKIPTPAALAGVAIGGVLVSGIIDYYNWATKAEREAKVQAEAMDVLASASETAGAAMEGASEGPRALGTEIHELGEGIQENWQSIADLGGAFAEIDAAAGAQVAQLSSARQAVADYNGQTDLSTQQLGSFRSAIETLNAQCGTNYEVVKDAGGAYYVMQDGARVAAEEIYGLVDAQIEQARVSAQLEKLEDLYAEQAEQAQEYAEAVQMVADAQAAYDAALEKYGDQGSNWALDDLEEAQANLAEVESQMGATGEAIAGVEEGIGNMTAAAQGAVEGFDALVMGSAGLNELFSATGLSMEDFADDLEASGVGLEALGDLSDAELMQLAARWDGTTGSIADAMAELGIEVPASAYAAMLGMSEGLSEGGAQAVQTALSVSGMTAEQFAAKVSEYGLSGEQAITAFANAIAAGDSYEVAAQKAREAVSGVSSQSGAAYAAGAQVGGSAASGMSSADSYTSGYHLGSNFAAGIRGSSGLISRAAAYAAQVAHDQLGFSVPKDGPWSGSEKGGVTSGLHLGQNFAEGMMEAIPDIERASEALADAASVDASSTWRAQSARAAAPYDAGGDGETDSLLKQVVQLLADIYGAIPDGMDQQTFGRAVRKAVGYAI